MTEIVDAKRLPGPPGGSNVMAAPIHPDGAARSVGPFVVVIHVAMPPVPPGVLPVDVDVRPHPHVGLAAVSYVLDGAITHRDSLGHRCELRAGSVGTTIAGRGAVHSERFERMRLLGGGLEMFQLLLALPDGHEDAEPSFLHRAGDEHPRSSADGASVRWLFPVPPAAPPGMPTTSPILLADLELDAGARWTIPDVAQRAIYVRAGELEVGGSRVVAGQVASPGEGEGLVRALAPSRALAFGGAPVGSRYMWWNYIHSSLERIEAAKADWRAGRMKLPPGDTESFTPCPADDGRPLWRVNHG